MESQTTETLSSPAPWLALKQTILDRAKAADACTEQYKRAKNAKDEKTLLEVVRENIHWCVSNKVVDGALLKQFTPEVLVEVGIFVTGHHEVRGRAAACFGNSTVRSFGNSTVRSFGNSTVRSYGNSTVRSYGNSTVRSYENSTVESYENSTVRSFGNSTVRSYENSTVRSFGNSTVRSYENSTVESYENSTVRSFGNSTGYIYNGKESKPSDRAIIRYQDFYDGPTTKIVIKKSAFEIVEIEG